ncbi:putative tetratricopeptide-like helical domain superfamily [Helianthus annuus]|nr:pentatricopeptide repeat-containing protein At2g20540 [Helianthus annuus]KAJ0442483.1 putative tetratricopeptide-like helical domain superfamily [Helianthus annuus]KAJ0640670.1 putative tetratricopeptide-like helical domain superfamily [Helianthus annuus]KAJ0644595.1 putative tetratricopeptide-like helical domain superfamily [Helianthus annuus]KAJ0820980.1 putative tetratricopeptide-like helical domain superfamily [Helianthus annuus]KAJ0835581.1 putative tetratricopeptide-like helical domai
MKSYSEPNDRKGNTPPVNMNTSLSSLKSLLDKCSKHENLITQIHAIAITSGLFHTHQIIACKLLNTYAKQLNNPTKAHKTFYQIHNPDIISWTCLMSLHLHAQQPFKTLSLFSDMITSTGFNPDGHCILAALSACGSVKNFLMGKMLHGMVVRYELDGEKVIVSNALIDLYSRVGRVDLGRKVFEMMGVKDVASWTSLVNGYVLCGDLVAAGQVFDEMPERNVVSWTAMIVGYVRGKDVVRGLKLFREMRMEGGGENRPTSITVVAVLSGCADVGALDFGGAVHAYVNKVADLVTDVSVNNALIDMYAKGGSLEFARKVFSKMSKKDVFSWTSLISGLALHGEGRAAVEVFNDMTCTKLFPNEITFLSVLSACSHGGLIKEGRFIFDTMVHTYGVKPTIKHYGCMMDLFCRAGHITEAMELIKKMPMKPDAVIWRSVLSACLIKQDLQLAETAAKKVVELEPNDDGVYMLLWNLYRLTNKWEDALTTRKLMRNRNIKKQPGCSWIEINGLVHEFTADGTMDQLAIDMQTLLEVLNGQSRLVHDVFIL